MKKTTKRFSKVSLMAIWLVVWSLFQSLWLIIISFSLLIIIVFEKYIWIKLPVYFTITFIIFTIFSVLLWNSWGFYEKYFWWDSMLHFFYWVWFSIIWYIIIYKFLSNQWVQDSHKIIVIFSFCFTLAFWAIWEIFEFSMDSFFWFNMQKTHIWNWATDTMNDIITETISAFLTNIYIFLYLRYGKKNWISIVTEDFKKLNIFNVKKQKNNS